MRGRLPRTLDGTLLRIGPDGTGREPLAGAPLVAGLRVRDGRAEWYASHRVRTAAVCRELGDLPTPGPRRGLSDDANAGLIRHAGRILALGDGGVLPSELGADLRTRARHDFDGTLSGGFAAHPVHDPLTGELHALAYRHQAPYAEHIVVGVDGRVRRSTPITVGKPSMMCAFALTEHYAVVFDLPVVFSPRAAAAGRRIPYAWDDWYGARIGLLPREGGDGEVRWFEIEPCFIFHVMNAYEDEDGNIVVDAVRHERAFDRDPLCPGEAQPVLWRWTVDPRGSVVKETLLDGRVQEYPAIDERFASSIHRYGFTAQTTPEKRPFGGGEIYFHDFAAGTVRTRDFGTGYEAGRPTFVPRAPDADEGDGWVFVFCYDPRADRGKIAVLDTADFTGPPVAEIALPTPGPRGFHSTWLTV